MLAAVSAPAVDADATGSPVLASSSWPWLHSLTIVATAVLAALTVALYLAGDWPWHAQATLRALAVASTIGVIPWLARRVRPTAALVPYGLFALTLGVAWIAAPTAAATGELWRYGLFLLVIAAAAAPPAVPRGALVGLHAAACCWCWLQLAGPRSAFDTIGRAGFYHALEHWSGYPELGLLMAVGACAMVAFACAARPPLVRVAAVVLAAGLRRARRVPAVALGGGRRSRSSRPGSPVVAAVNWRSRRRPRRWRSACIGADASSPCAAAASTALASRPRRR